MVTQSVPEFSLWHRSTASPPGRRIRPEGADNYAKSRGTLHRVVFSQDPSTSSSPASSSPPSSNQATPRKSPRCATPAARVNYELGVHGHVGDVLKGTSKARPTSAPARVKPEAADIANRSQGSRMRKVLQEQNQDGCRPESAVPRVKPEGKTIATMSKGRRMSTLIHEYGQHLEPAARPAPRVSREAQENAQTAKGGRMHNLLHQYGMGTTRAVPRVRPEGTSNAALGKGARMDSLIHQYGSQENTHRSTPRVTQEAETNAERGKGKRMAALLQSPTSTTSPSIPSPFSSCRPTPRVRPEASQFASLDRGPRMAQLLHDDQSIPEPPRPSSRAVGEQAKRNLWHGVIGSVGNCLKQSGRKSCPFMPSAQPSRSLSQPCVV